MCGRYTLHSGREQLLEHFQAQTALALPARFNIAPSQPVPVVRQGAEGREWAMLTWGLVPAWAKDSKSGYRMINARAETVATKPSFRAAFRRRRCLIPADGFYEWQAGPQGKQPYHIRLNDNTVFAFAGLWEHWESEAGAVLESCAIIVTEANERVRPIHERMPVILAPDSYSTWLDPDQDSARLQALLKPYPASLIDAYPVSARVNSPKHDSIDCITPWSPGA